MVVTPAGTPRLGKKKRAFGNRSKKTTPPSLHRQSSASFFPHMM